MCSVEVHPYLDLSNIMRRINCGRSSRPDRVEPRTPAGVRRVLFGVAHNHEETARDLSRHLQELERETQQRWNFDFKSESPLPGRYEWCSMGTRSRVRTAVSEATAGSSSGGTTSDAPTTSEVVPTKLETKTSSEAVGLKTKNIPVQQPLVQRKVTDYMNRKRKRPASIPKYTKADIPAVKGSKLRRAIPSSSSTSSSAAAVTASRQTASPST